MTSKRQAFTLLELIVVLAIVSIFFALLLGAVQRARAMADRSACQNHLRQITLAVHSYVGDHGCYPIVIPPLTGPHFQWLVYILPYLDQSALFAKAIQASQIEPMAFMIPPHTPAQEVVSVYLCPSDWRIVAPQESSFGQRLGFSSFLGVSGRQTEEIISDFERRSRRGIFYRSIDSIPVRPQDVTDGLTNTLLIGERPPPPSWDAGWWYTQIASPLWLHNPPGPNSSMTLDDWSTEHKPCYACYGPGRINNESDRYHFWSLHANGSNFSFADGSVRFILYSAGPRMLALATMAGGESVDSE